MTIAPVPTPVEQPYLTGGDWVTLWVGTGAALIAIGAAVIAWLAKRTADRAANAAERAAEANERMVQEQAEANSLTRQEIELLQRHRADDLATAQMREEVEDRQEVAEAVRRAQLITKRLKVYGNGLRVTLAKNSGSPVTQVQIVNAVWTAYPEWNWAIDEYAHSRTGEPSSCDVLPTGGEYEVWVEFADETGVEPTYDGAVEVDFEVSYQFTDGRGTRWERTNNGDPHTVRN